MLVCLQKQYKGHKHVFKRTTACSRLITSYKMVSDRSIVTCVTRAGSRPSWYVVGLHVRKTMDGGRFITASGAPPVTTSISLSRVNCVDCLDSGYYGLQLLKETDVE